MSKDAKRRVSVLIPAELCRQLDELAQRSSRSLSSYIRQVLKWHLSYLDQFQAFFCFLVAALLTTAQRWYSNSKLYRHTTSPSSMPSSSSCRYTPASRSLRSNQFRLS